MLSRRMGARMQDRLCGWSAQRGVWLGRRREGGEVGDFKQSMVINY